MRILAADIGGTSTRLAIFEMQAGSVQDNSAQIRDLARKGVAPIASQRYPSADYGGLEAILAEFTARHGHDFSCACFGLAGPIRGGVASLSNLPWVIDAHALAQALGISHVWLINDLEANAYGIPLLGPDDLAPLAVGAQDDSGNAAVISAGTGLGEAGMVRDGARLLPFATEGGHADFAPRDELEVELWRYLGERFGRVSYERVVSGPGLANIYEFLRQSGRGEESPEIAARLQREDPAAVISTAALAKSCGLCSQALSLFVRVYGAEAGNLALRTLATGGIYLGGGIAPKILPALQGGEFMKAFVDKGRMTPLMDKMPVFVILNPGAALLGAGRYAALHAGGKS